jgi:hypothetical protein
MVIVEIRNTTTSYALYADIARSGDLVVVGHDLSAGTAELTGGDEYEYVYTVRADAVPALCERLGVEPGALLDGLQRLLTPHGIAASTAWRAWLVGHSIPYEFAVR